jgi:hypothetical protein
LMILCLILGSMNVIFFIIVWIADAFDFFLMK